MALKADRYEESTDISFFSSTTGVRGMVVCLDAAAVAGASGAGMDQGENTVSPIAALPASVPVGIILNDVVNKDLTRTHLNQYKDEVQLGGKVTVMTRGWVVTNNITGTPKAGDVAYASNTIGTIDVVASNAAATGNLAIGRWMSRKDADGYAKLYVNLPNHGGSA
jgi:hypothetical protein